MAAGVAFKIPFMYIFPLSCSASLNAASRTTGCPVPNPCMDSGLGRISTPWVRANLGPAQRDRVGVLVRQVNCPLAVAGEVAS